MKKLLSLLFITIALNSSCLAAQSQPAALVFQSDFGVKDAAVASMKGVAFGVSPGLSMYDLTHEIPAFNVWEAAQRLVQTAEYWPSGTVFVSVVDPGVGTDRKSVVLKTKSGHYFVTPDNGTLTLVAEKLGIAELREIDEAVNRRQNSEQSYTFHGRDVYAYTGARLAAGVISFEQVGDKLEPKVVTLEHQQAKIENGVVYGNIPILDPQYGNVWTNINREIFGKLGVSAGEALSVKIRRGEKVVYSAKIPFANTFGEVAKGSPLIYYNSLNNVAIALNQGNFAQSYEISSGSEWSVEFRE